MKDIKMYHLILLLSLSYSSLSSQGFYTKIIHNTDPDAKCLDGSGPMIYLHEGGDTQNILFYFIGGGSCAGTDLPSTLQSCYRRSKTQFGSSKFWPNVFYSSGGGLLETDQTKSMFANWTKIVIIYCDGSFHQGNNKSPIQYKDALLYFRGAVNTRSHVKWADSKYGLNKAQRIVVSGSSAGGIATYLWVDYFRSLVSNPKIVYGVVDSGIFYDPAVNYQLLLQKTNQKKLSLSSQEIEANQAPIQVLLTLSNTDEKTPNKQCSQSLSSQQFWKCVYIQYSYPTLKYPLLFVQASYDEYVIAYSMNIKCLVFGDSGYSMKNCSQSQIQAIEYYRTLYFSNVVPNLLNNGHSLWSISCSWHAEIINSTIYDSELQRVPKLVGPTIRNVVESFVFEEKRILAIDAQSWPSNTPCAY